MRKNFPQEMTVVNSGLVYVDVARETAEIQITGTIKVPLAWWRQYQAQSSFAVTVSTVEPARNKGATHGKEDQ